MIRNPILFQSSIFYYFVWLINKDFSKGLSLNTMKIWLLYSCDNNNRNNKHKRYHNKYDKNVWRLYLHFNHVWIKVRLRLPALQPARLLVHRQVSENHISKIDLIISNCLLIIFTFKSVREYEFNFVKIRISNYRLECLLLTSVTIDIHKVHMFLYR